jgi:hypothetical protein
MVESRESGEHSLQHLVNELSRVEEGLRRARAVMGEELSHDEAGVRALERRREELQSLIAKRQGRSRGAAGGTPGEDPQAGADRVTTTIR